MAELSFPLTQSLQLAALGPCLFIIAYVVIMTKRVSYVLVPVLYFVVLSLSFLFPVLQQFPSINIKALFPMTLMNELLMPFLSFLLILQFMLGRPPKLTYWLMLAIPLVGGLPMFYLSVTGQEVCFSQDGCVNAIYMMQLYKIFGASLVFALLLAVLGRSQQKMTIKERIENHRYWLIIALIIFNVLALINDLVFLTESMTLQQYEFLKTLSGVVFVYLVLSSIFRAFGPTMKIQSIEELTLSSTDKALIAKMNNFIHENKPYLELGFNRAALADAMAVTEQKLSFVINRYYGKSFSDVMNEFRVKEAKHLLMTSDAPVTNVSYDVGFSSIASFNRVFKEKTGVSPSEFRRRNHEEEAAA